MTAREGFALQWLIRSCLYWVINIGLLLIASQLFARVLDSNWQDLILTE